MSLIFRMTRLFVAMTLLTGYGPVYAAPSSAPSSSNRKERAQVQPRGAKKANPAERAKVMAGYGRLPVAFEPNHGQTDASVKFLARVNDYQLSLTAQEAVWTLPRAKTAKSQGFETLRMSLKGANPAPAVSGRDVLPGHTSYFLGNDPKKWRIGVEQYAKVEYRQVYPGIDLIYYGNQRTLEHDFIVAPGADPRRIQLHFEGAQGLTLNANGDVTLGLKAKDTITFHAPVVYQRVGNAKHPIQGRLVVAGKKDLRFEIGAYDRSRELVIDPQLVYSTYLGGSVDDEITAIAVDGTQQAYVTGWSNSAPSGVSGFPAAANTYPAAIGPNNGGSDVFVAKLSADGSTLLWLAWLGGALADQATGIALDNTSAGTPNVYITGVTASPTFPVAGPALQACSPNTGTLAFAAELTQPANIPNIIYSTCWGGVSGSLGNSGNAIAVDSLGAAYITGTTFASNFPISLGIPAPYNTMGAASQDAFVVKIAPAGSSVVYSMLLGPSSVITNGNAIAVDTGFQAWVAGMTTSSTLPAVLGHFASSNVGTSDAFVAEVNSSGTGLLYATYINGNSDQTATAIALDSGGKTPYNVFVAGWTLSPTGFPSVTYYNEPTSVRPVVYQKNLSGSYDPFILRLNPNAVNPSPGSDNPLEMVFATHLGATGADEAFALALDDADDSYIAGWTVSSDWTLAADPVTPGPNGINTTGATTQNTAGGQDAFVAAISSGGTYQPFFSYLGATPPGQAATGIVIDALHNIYVAGFTPSAIFPLTTGSLEDSSTPSKSINRSGTAGSFDGFVTKIAPVASFPPPQPSVCTITSDDPSAGPEVGGTTVTISGTGFMTQASSGTVSFNGSTVPFTLNGSSTVITAVSPRNPPSGPLMSGTEPLVVTTPGGSCSTNYSYEPPGLSSCTISNYSPTSGYTLGGTTVTIIGENFFGVVASTDVSFGGVNASTYTVNKSSTGITAVTPTHPVPGQVNLLVVTSSGTCSVSYDYVTPPAGACTIGTIYPASGFTLGGTTVTITGTGLYGFPPGGSGVTFDGNNAISYTANASSTVITAFAPRHPLTGNLATGPVPLDVTTNHGSCSATYDYLLSPAAPGAACGEDYFFPSPDSGPVGNFAYCMAAPGTMTVRVYNVVGEIVAKVVDAKPAGAQLSTLNTARLVPGVYLYLLEKAYAGGNTVHNNVQKFVVRH